MLKLLVRLLVCSGSVRTISCEPLNPLWPNLVWRCTLSSRLCYSSVVVYNYQPESHVRKTGLLIFEVMVTVRVHIIKMWLSLLRSEVLIFSETKLVWWYSITSRTVLRKRLDCCVQVRSDGIFWTAEPFASKPQWWCIVRHAERFVCYLQDHGHSKGHIVKTRWSLSYLLKYWTRSSANKMGIHWQ